MTLQLTVVVWFIFYGASEEPWLVTQIPTSTFTFFGNANTADLLKAQAQIGSLDYCNNAAYNYGDQYCRSTSTNSSCNSVNPADQGYCGKTRSVSSRLTCVRPDDCL